MRRYKTNSTVEILNRWPDSQAFKVHYKPPGGYGELQHLAKTQRHTQLGMSAHICSSSTQEAESGGSLWVQNQSDQYTKTLSKNKKKTKEHVQASVRNIINVQEGKECNARD